MIGEPLRRLEDPRLITGRGRYVDDLAEAETLHAVFVRSVEAHATITSIEFEGGENSGALLLTAEDLGLQRPMPVQNPSPVIEQPITSPPLATDEVCYVGQPIAVVVAATPQGAVDAAESVFVGYEPMAASIDLAATLDEQAPPVHREGTSNLAATLKMGFGDAAGVIDGAERVVRLEFDQHRGALASLEGRAVLAKWDGYGERMAIWSSTQAPHIVRNMVADYLGLSQGSVRVSTPDVGGGFGPKAVVHPEEIVLPALARHLGSTVKWTERRREHFTATIQQRGQRGIAEAAYDERGRILALRARLQHDLGAFVPYGIVVAATTARLMSGPYVVPHLDVEVACVFTNATPTGAIRGAGRPNAVFIVERIVDAIAAALSIDRAEVRRRNFISADSFPYRLDLPASDGNPLTYDGGDYRAGLEAALDAADVDGFEVRRAASARRHRLRGYGIASYVEDTGLGPSDGARLEILGSGEVVLDVGTSSQGQGHATVFSQICAAHLGIDPNQVRVRAGDTDHYPEGVATVASRTGQTVAVAVEVTAVELAETVKQLAAERLEAAQEAIVLVDGVAMVVGQPGSEIPLGELAAGCSSEQVVPYAGSAFTYGTHVAEVEIDIETGQTSVVSYVVVHDCGTVLNPMIVDGQIDGAVAHGLGNALTERVVHNAAGQPLTASFMDYQLMSAAEMPVLTKVHMETPSPTNALGAKGAGEGGTIPAAAAVVSAIEHALGAQTPITHYPVSPEFVLGALNGSTGDI